MTIDNKYSMRSGQVLIIVLLVIVVVLALGLSVASKNITNLRTATQTEQSQRAFSAAEGGIESALAKVSSGSVAGGANFTLKELGISNDVNGTVSVAESRTYGGVVALGNVAQIDLNGFPGDRDIRILWAKNNEKDSDGPASLEITQIFDTSPVQQVRYFIKGSGSRVRESAVSNPAGLSDCPGFSPGEFLQCKQVRSKSNAKILRIKPFWVDTTVKVASTDLLQPLPVQTYDVVSTATTDIGVTRKVQVTKTALKQLPAVFDYVLFSEGSVIK